MIKYIDALIPSQEQIVDALREKKSAYPMLAIREAVANALIHQDFSIKGTGWDKIAISCEMFQLPAPKMDLYESNTRAS